MSGVESFDINVMDRYIKRYGLSSSRMRELNPIDLASEDFTGRAFLANRFGPWDSLARVMSERAEDLAWNRNSLERALTSNRTSPNPRHKAARELLAESLEVARKQLAQSHQQQQSASHGNDGQLDRLDPEVIQQMQRSSIFRHRKSSGPVETRTKRSYSGGVDLDERHTGLGSVIDEKIRIPPRKTESRLPVSIPLIRPSIGFFADRTESHPAPASTPKSRTSESNKGPVSQTASPVKSVAWKSPNDGGELVLGEKELQDDGFDRDVYKRVVSPGPTAARKLSMQFSEV